MKQRLFGKEITNGYLKGKALTKGWSLCIGAGTSVPAFPNWRNLVLNLIKRDLNVTNEKAYEEILESFSLDALIQASTQILNLKEDEFTKILSDELYSNITSNTSPEEWESIKNIFTTVKANRTINQDWKNFIKVRERLFKKSSSYALAKVIIESYDAGFPPSSILSFNAEPLLYSLINSFERERIIKASNSKVRDLVDLISISIASKTKGRIPYYFCHGALLSNLSEKHDKRLQSTSKLVFSESSYLQIANTSFSWQSVNFLGMCSNTSVIFIGVSLSDPNMRKWLTWIQNERSKEIQDEADSTQHFWINKKPDYQESIPWIEASVLHLGIRIIWLDDWTEVENTMRRLLGL